MTWSRAPFPSTRPSAVRATASLDPNDRRQARATLVGAYWKPVYKHLRLRFRANPEDAQDLVQGLFAELFDGDGLATFDPARGRFRTWLRRCADHHASRVGRDAGRLKRGGGLLAVDFAQAEVELVGADEDPDRVFDDEWVRGLLARTVEALREELAGTSEWALFEATDLADDPRPTYRELALRQGVPVTTVTNRLALARRRFRQRALEQLRELCASDEEYRDEARELFGLRS